MATPAVATVAATAPSDYGLCWEKFWSTVSEDPQDVLWNASHDEAVAIDWEIMKGFVLAEKLPLVDVGCGDGTQTTFFSGRVLERAIGVDVSAAAIDIANRTKAADGVTYQVLDLLDEKACRDFHDRVVGGDSHVYMRGVLMQFSLSDRPAAAENLKIIMGSRGCMYLHEYVPQTKAYYGSIFQKQGMPMGFKRVLDSGIKPGGIARDEMRMLFKGYDVLQESDQHTMSTIIALEGGEADVARAPGFYMLLRKLSDK
mmetsp:Transcript_20103/g.33352  ORF Transcript_20103/g.33352 Transcript_20103/m.33352 type:complete len:257 (+) Transcript_20103:30-800(+)|eukprot:CAMPEP_0119016138 /NCGR_PEP_ID=MMETSP1176-20130426/11837_1 /TAXON_ID=265551 /ORGANISM="Synedropsis recta cf, Strain CCMP1620" /LENGTH=256 /DNA_ID=CAMNT_0006969471 /DNA_START=30 /DNA_END=800 /DNA_ORIENTATION=-